MIKIYNLKGQLLYDIKSPEFNALWDSHSKCLFFTISWVNDYNVGVRCDLHHNSKYYLMIGGKKFDYYKILENPEYVMAFIEQEKNKEALENLPG